MKRETMMWKVEERFRNWDYTKREKFDSENEFLNWALEVKRDADNAALEAELRELFMKELYEREF